MDLDKKRQQLFGEIGKNVKVEIVPVPNSNNVCLRVYFTNLGATIVKLNVESELKYVSLENELADIIRIWFFLPQMINWEKNVARVHIPSNVIFVDRTYVNGRLITADCINHEPYMLSPDCKKCSIEIWSQRLKRI